MFHGTNYLNLGKIFILGPFKMAENLSKSSKIFKRAVLMFLWLKRLKHNKSIKKEHNKSIKDRVMSIEYVLDRKC